MSTTALAISENFIYLCASLGQTDAQKASLSIYTGISYGKKETQTQQKRA
ncbi:hypothetical protein [Prevotella histicola]